MLTAAFVLLLPLFIAGLISAFFNLPTKKLIQILKSLSLGNFDKHLADNQPPPPTTQMEEKKKKNHHPDSTSEPKSTVVDRSELKRVFSTFDKNNDGFISKQELKESFKNIGIHMTEGEIADTVEKVDSNGDGSIDIDEFCGLFDSVVGKEKTTKEVGVDEDGKEPEDDEESGLKDAFDVFDGDKDGLITVEELGMVLSSLGLKEGLRLENCKAMINKVDVDGDGMVNFDEFKMMMKNGGNLVAAIS